MKNKKKFVVASIGIVVSIGLGVTAGLVINKFFLGPVAAVNYSEFDEESYAPNYEESLALYNQKKNTTSDYSTVFTPDEMINIGYARYIQEENTCAYSYGTVTAAIAKQAVRAMDIKKDGKHFQESTSAGLVSVGLRTYLENDEIKTYRATNVSGDAESCEWDATSETTYTKEEYAEEYGKTPEDPMIILISKGTIKQNQSNIVKTNDGYKVNVVFNRKTAVINYVKQMKAVSNLEEYPVFYALSATFDLDSNLMIKHVTTNESYYALLKKGVGSQSDGVLDVYYYVNNEVEIPSLNDDINYEVGRSF